MTIATCVTIPLKKIQLTPGSTISITDVTWAEFEAILEERETAGIRTRIAYSKGTLEISSPFAEEERAHRLISYIVKVLLDAQERDWEDFGATTFKKKAKEAGLEPDTCLYIQHAGEVRDCMRMDLTIYPPPDLAIEADVTSLTTLDVYQALEVPEVWVYTAEKFVINVLIDGEYVESNTSPLFPDLPIQELIPDLVKQAFKKGSSRMLRELREELKEK